MNLTSFISPKQTYPLRLEVLWHHFNSLSQCTLDIDDFTDTFHVGAFYKKNLVTIGTFTQQKNNIFTAKNQYRLRAMASAELVRGKGFGKKVINFALIELQKRNVDLLWCNAREVAFGFYKNLGFKTIGEFYDIPKIGPHKLMYFEIKN